MQEKTAKALHGSQIEIDENGKSIEQLRIEYIGKISILDTLIEQHKYINEQQEDNMRVLQETQIRAIKNLVDSQKYKRISLFMMVIGIAVLAVASYWFSKGWVM